jgi:hypothetical protein
LIRCSISAMAIYHHLATRSYCTSPPISQPTAQVEGPPVSGGPGYIIGSKVVRRLWFVDDFCKGASQFGGANSLTHGDEQLVGCSIG